MAKDIHLHRGSSNAYQLGVQAILDQDFEKGIQLLESSLTNNPHVPTVEAYSMLMVGYYSLRRFKDAYHYLDLLENFDHLPAEILAIMRQIKTYRTTSAAILQPEEVDPTTKAVVNKVVDKVKKETGGDINLQIIDTSLFNVEGLLENYPESQLLNAISRPNDLSEEELSQLMADNLILIRDQIECAINLTFTKITLKVLEVVSDVMIPLLIRPELIVLTTEVDHELIEDNKCYDQFPYLNNFLFSRYAQAVFGYGHNENRVLNYQLIPFGKNEFSVVFEENFNKVFMLLNTFIPEILEQEPGLMSFLFDLLLVSTIKDDVGNNEIAGAILLVLNTLKVSNIKVSEINKAYDLNLKSTYPAIEHIVKLINHIKMRMDSDENR